MTVRVPVRMLRTGSQGDSCAALYKGETVNATAVYNTMARSPDTPTAGSGGGISFPGFSGAKAVPGLPSGTSFIATDKELIGFPTDH